MLIMNPDLTFSQGDNILLRERKAIDSNLFEGNNLEVPRSPGINPNSGSIWVNRNETVKGKPVTEFTPEEFVKEVLLGLGANSNLISNVTFRGFNWNHTTKTWKHSYARGLSYFSHGELERDTVIYDNVNYYKNYTIKLGLGMESGLLLCTYSGRETEGPNNYDGYVEGGIGQLDSPTTEPKLNDPDISGLIPTYTVYDGALLEFDFEPLSTPISFDYIFASEEYPEYVNSVFNDVFGFFISEVGPDGNPIQGTTINIAKLPATQTGNYAVTINNVNNGYTEYNHPQFYPGTNLSNPQYFVANYLYPPMKGKYMEYDGRTVMLTAKADVIPGKKYHLKLGVANVGDNRLGSGVFLRSGSLNLGSLGGTFYGNDIVYNNLFEHLFCENTVDFDLKIETTGEAIVDSMKWYIDGVEYLPAQNLYKWSQYFDVGNYNIEVELYNNISSLPVILQGILHVGAHIETQVNPTGAGTITGDGCYQVGKTATLAATHELGYGFLNWTTPTGEVLSSNNPYTFTITENKTIVANFYQSYTITPSAGANGSITPNTPQTVDEGENKTFTFTPANCYEVDQVLVDGTPITFTGNSYTFENVTANHTISVTFKLIQYTITASAGPNGTINPEGEVKVNCGANQTFTFIPGSGYILDQVFVNGVLVTESNNNYKFMNVTKNNTIEVSFKEYNGYRVTLPVISCMRFIPTEDSVSPVDPGDSFSFTVEYGDCYDISYIDVFANGILLTPEAGVYTITDIMEDQIVTVRVHR